MARVADLEGAAHLLLFDRVVYLDPAPAVFDAMIEGWKLQQRTRYLKADTIRDRVALVRRMAEFTNDYPWSWQCADAEAFFAHLDTVRGKPLAFSTAAGYQADLRLFCGYVTDPRYGWGEECLRRFGQTPVQLFHEANAIVRAAEYEGDPHRRPLTYDEVQALFDAADALVEQAQAKRRKGALAAARDAAVLKTIYAYGLRRQEAAMLDLADFRRNPKVKRFGRCGGLFVRFGKASPGCPPKRRTVLLVPEMDWILPVHQQWLTQLRPLFSPGAHPALWVTERCGRLSRRSINEAFAEARDAAGLDPVLDLHCLRHSYVTHLIEFGYAEKFVQDQVGHEYASTTAIYTGVGDGYRNALLMAALKEDNPELFDQEDAS